MENMYSNAQNVLVKRRLDHKVRAMELSNDCRTVIVPWHFDLHTTWIVIPTGEGWRVIDERGSPAARPKSAWIPRRATHVNLILVVLQTRPGPR